jgi:hypothetical protein
LFGSEFFQKKAPKIIIFDEAETLTEQAQSALRPLLDKPASELLIIFLCNSISRIHSSILHRFLRIYFETPSADQFRSRFQPIFELTHSTGPPRKLEDLTKNISPSDIYYRRGDIRFFLLQYNKAKECNTFGWLLLHIPKQELFAFLEKQSQTMYIGEMISQALFLFQSLGCVEPENILAFLSFADADLIAIRPLSETLFEFAQWVVGLRDKFEF